MAPAGRGGASGGCGVGLGVGKVAFLGGLGGLFCDEEGDTALSVGSGGPGAVRWQLR